MFGLPCKASMQQIQEQKILRKFEWLTIPTKNDPEECQIVLLYLPALELQGIDPCQHPAVVSATK